MTPEKRHQRKLPKYSGPIRAAIYARISPIPGRKEEDENGIKFSNFSPSSQLNALRKRCAELNYQNAEEFVDENFSGGTLDRPALHRIREKIRAGELDVVMAYSTDRLVRDLALEMILENEAKAHDCRYTYVCEQFDDTPEGDLQKRIKSVVNQYEKAKIRERTMRCKREKVTVYKLPVHAKVPYGLKYSGRKLQAKVEIEPKGAEVARKVFALAGAGLRLSQLKNQLNREKIPSAKGGLWSPRTVWQMLTNPAYKGQLRGVEGFFVPCPQIVSEEVWEKAQATLKHNSTAWVGQPSEHYLLRNFMSCFYCQRRCVGVHGARRGDRDKPRYYRCGNAETKLYERKCDARGIRRELLEDAAWDLIWDALTNEGLLRSKLAEYHAGMRDAGDERTALEKELAAVKRQETHYVRLLADPQLVDFYEQYKAEALQFRAQRFKIEAELNRCRIAVVPGRDQISETCRKFKRIGPRSYSEKRRVLEETGAEIILKTELRDERGYKAPQKVSYEVNLKVVMGLARSKNHERNQHSDHDTGITFELPLTLQGEIAA